MVDAGAQTSQAVEIVSGLLTSIEPFGLADAAEAAPVRELAGAVTLSLGDRGCLALARRTGWPIFTADRAWLAVPDALDQVRTLRSMWERTEGQEEDVALGAFSEEEGE